MDQYIAGRIVQTFFRQSKAERSYIYSMEIQQHGFDTPEPVAMIEQKQKVYLHFLPLSHPSGNGLFRHHHNNKCNSYVKEGHSGIVRSESGRK